MRKRQLAQVWHPHKHCQGLGINLEWHNKWCDRGAPPWDGQYFRRHLDPETENLLRMSLVDLTGWLEETCSLVCFLPSAVSRELGYSVDNVE